MNNAIAPSPNPKSWNSPMMWAAYVTWAAIGVDLLTRGSPNAWLSSAFTKPMVLFLHGLILALMLTRLRERDDSARQRVLVDAQAICALLILAMMRSNAGPILSILVVAQWFEVYSQRTALLRAVMFNVALFVILTWLWKFKAVWLMMTLFGGFQAFAALTNRALQDSESARAKLAQINGELMATRHLLEVSARDQERLRLARELHDVAGHKLTALKLNLAAINQPSGNNTQTPANQDSLRQCEDLASELLADIRAVVAHTRSEQGMDMRAALETAARGFPRPRLELDLADDAKPETSLQAEAILRAVQEALTNAARHSNANQLWVKLTRVNDQLQLHIHDDGKAVVPIQLGNGLLGMRERFNLLGGALNVTQSNGRGLQLLAELPLRS